MKVCEVCKLLKNRYGSFQSQGTPIMDAKQEDPYQTMTNDAIFLTNIPDCSSVLTYQPSPDRIMAMTAQASAQALTNLQPHCVAYLR